MSSDPKQAAAGGAVIGAATTLGKTMYTAAKPMMRYPFKALGGAFMASQAIGTMKSLSAAGIDSLPRKFADSKSLGPKYPAFITKIRGFDKMAVNMEKVAGVPNDIMAALSGGQKMPALEFLRDVIPLGTDGKFNAEKLHYFWDKGTVSAIQAGLNGEARDLASKLYSTAANRATETGITLSTISDFFHPTIGSTMRSSLLSGSELSAANHLGSIIGKSVPEIVEDVAHGVTRILPKYSSPGGGWFGQLKQNIKNVPPILPVLAGAAIAAVIGERMFVKYLDKRKTGKSFDKMLEVYPELTQSDQKVVRDVFTHIADYSPTVANNPYASGSIVKRYIESGNVLMGHDTIQQLLNVEKTRGEIAKSPPGKKPVSPYLAMFGLTDSGKK